MDYVKVNEVHIDEIEKKLSEFIKTMNEKIENKKVLIVEDETLVALSIKKNLISLGYEVVGVASSSVKAHAIINENMPDIVLMDIKIKGDLDGVETSEEIKRLYDIPVVFF